MRDNAAAGIIKQIQLFKPYSGYILVLYAILILTVSSLPHIPTLKIHTAKADIRLDYLIHFCEYGLLALLSRVKFSDENFLLSGRKYLIVASGLILFAVFDELHQKFIPGRSVNFFDMLSNVLGIITALLLTSMLFRRRLVKKV